MAMRMRNGDEKHTQTSISYTYSYPPILKAQLANTNHISTLANLFLCYENKVLGFFVMEGSIGYYLTKACGKQIKDLS
jgi:hypothetical protein